MTGFIQKYGLWNDDQRRLAGEIDGLVHNRELGVIRLSAVDQHGVLRGKTLTVDELGGAFSSGVTFVSSILAKDTSCRSVFPVFTPGAGMGLRGMEGAADIIMVPDPTTFKVLPWAPHSGWMLCDLYFGDGKPVPFSTRQILRSVLEKLHAKGLEYVAGLEVEFHIFKLRDAKTAPEDAGQPGAPPEVEFLTQGYQLLAEHRYDIYDPVLEPLRSGLEGLGLPLRSLEVELGPSQVEFTFRPATNLQPADTMVLLRSAVKQICRRNGYHATFMCKPKLANIGCSGWHLHQSLRDRRSGKNAFVPDGAGPLSPLGMHYVGGLLAHAAASAAFAAPTINGYRRYRPMALAPDRIIWGRDNRGAMARVLGGTGDPASRIENRIGEPTANPYLYMASQVLAGLDGMERKLDPGPSADTPYEAKATSLPRVFDDALQALKADACYREGLGATFVDYYLHIKEAELARFRRDVPDWKERDPLEVTDWEQREYFELF